MNDVLVYNNWDPLEEIWLGDTYPEHFYDDLKSEVRDDFCKLTEYTKEDLNAIEKKFNEFNVVVKRPQFKDKSHYIDKKLNKLIKPPICPRDDNAVIDNQLFYTNGFGGVFTELATQYNSNNVKLQSDFLLSGAGIVKLGKDLIFDFAYNEDTALYPYLSVQDRKIKIFKHFKRFNETISNFIKDYRIHYSTNGGHVDACFMPVRPGLVLGNSYWPVYDLTLPNWKKLFIYEPTYKKEEQIIQGAMDKKHHISGTRWLIPHLSKQKHFNKYVETHCKEWIGNYEETYFEVNIIMLDEKNMMCIDTAGIHDPLFEILNKEGINIHIVPWRTRRFWDGGLHCITLDVRRKATKLDYFPERGDNGIKSVSTHFNGNSLDIFMDQYNQWLSTN